MEEIVKVKLAESQLALTKEAYALLAHFLDNTAKAYAHLPEKSALVEQTEVKIATLLMAKQSPNEVVERDTMARVVAQVGYPEGYTPAHTPTAQPTAKPQVSTLSRIVTTLAKVLLGIFLAGWVVTAIGLLVGFVTLMALGDAWSQHIPIDGISPIVFVGLVCAVIVLFMGIVADLIFRLIAGRKVQLRHLAVAGLVWLFFLLWLVFVSVRSVDKWAAWGIESRLKLEQWEESINNWTDAFEEDVEEFADKITVDSQTITLELNTPFDAIKFGILCEEFDELYRYDEEVIKKLVKGKEVTVQVEAQREGDIITRTTTITTPDKVDIVTVCLDCTTGTPIHHEIIK